jgi:hypothetical protein
VGARFLFTCGSCGYSAAVSGGRDEGECGFTQTISCGACRKLFDVPVATGDLRCPQVAKHHVQAWGERQGCPACGAEMERGPLAFLWD